MRQAPGTLRGCWHCHLVPLTCTAPLRANAAGRPQVHNHHGPHNATFYKLLDQYTEVGPGVTHAIYMCMCAHVGWGPAAGQLVCQCGGRRHGAAGLRTPRASCLLLWPAQCMPALPPAPCLGQECEELMSKGISGSGAGFDAAPAGKVGGRFVGHGDPAPHRKRELALRAAEQRARKQALMPAGPKKLGEWVGAGWGGIWE